MSLLSRGLERRTYVSHDFLVDPSVIPPPGLETVATPLVAGRGGLRHWAVWACARTIADAISTLPVDLLQVSPEGPVPVDSLPTMLQQPSAYADRVDWLSQVMIALLTTGNVYGLISSRDRNEYPTQINLVAPGAITAQIDAKSGRKVFKGPNGRTFSNEQVWHRTGLVWPGEVVGMDPITHFARTVALGLDAEQYGASFFSQGAHPTAVAHTDQEITQEQAQTIKDRIKRAVANRDIAVLGAGLELEPWQSSPNDTQLVETIRTNAAMVCAIFGVPPEKIGVSVGTAGSVTYANREQRAQDFLNDAVNPWLVRLERAMSEWFPRGKFVKFNTGGFLKSDLKTRFEAYRLATGDKPWMLPSEARAFENWAPIVGIDTPEPSVEPSDGGDQ